MRSGTDITAQRASEFGLPGQQLGESDSDFRARISGALRAKGYIIEAHEAHANTLYDDPDGDAMTGIMGAMAQTLQRRHYGAKTGYDQVGDDIASGVVAQSPDDDAAGLLGLMAMLLSK